MTHLRINRKAISVNLGPGLQQHTWSLMQFIYREISRQKHEIMLRDVLPELFTVRTAFAV